MKHVFRKRQKNKRGVTLVVFALSISVLVAMLGVALDGSVAFGERRQMQNAADTAALAGTEALNNYLEENGSATAVWETVQRVANENGVGTVECNWVYLDTELGECSDISNIEDLNGNLQVSGVRVRTAQTNDTTFARIMGVDEIKSGASATAQVLKVGQFFGQDVPFLICAYRGGNNPNEGPDILEELDGPTFRINPAAYGQWYNLHGPGNNIGSCGFQGNSFMGLADYDASPDGKIPGEWFSMGGNRTGPVRQNLGSIEGCNVASFSQLGSDPCYLVLPLCYNGQGNANGGKIYCVALGTFLVEQGHVPGSQGSNNNTHRGKLVPNSIMVPTGSGSDVPDRGEPSPRTIRLTE